MLEVVVAPLSGKVPGLTSKHSTNLETFGRIKRSSLSYPAITEEEKGFMTLLPVDVSSLSLSRQSVKKEIKQGLGSML